MAKRTLVRDALAQNAFVRDRILAAVVELAAFGLLSGAVVLWAVALAPIR